MNDGWAGILDADEEVLWQGQPEPGVRFEWRNRSKPLFFGFFTIVSVYLMIELAAEGGMQWTLILPFFFIGLYHLVLVHFWSDYLRRHTHYTVTSRRALVATETFGRRSLRSYPLTQSTEPELVEDRGGLADIYFAEKLRVVQDDRRDGLRGTRTSVRKIGFEGLRDGRKVYDVLRRARANLQGETA